MVCSTQYQVDKAASRTQQKPSSSSSKSGSKQHLLPGIRCPTCHASGKEVWVLPGKDQESCWSDCDAMTGNPQNINDTLGRRRTATHES
ncbi:uncharacterized protein LY79DRAFT_33851 [Colletotrichum navitas]|uniref:Uncharacterized protein n=1 Tax=Colletotrichum navitas TaxID=681940 RepID=A0AAD8Q7V9_9PEZI|nr:uncharacterized protein LY79DRAFT_33851 [Colletotrichum navitas]KAK1596861.1 hypothetical protein LY79DRAFT_33851 [Colletotrichum navitas]